MANWILAEWLCQVFDRDPDYTICRDRISAGGFDRPDMQEVSPCQDSFCMKSTMHGHIQAFFALTMDELKQLGIEPMAIRKKLFMAIQSESSIDMDTNPLEAEMDRTLRYESV